MVHARQIDSILDVSADSWNALTGTTQPFIQHGFLAALEASGSVTAGDGWAPAHLLLENDAGELVGAAPLYKKDHSFGEFVFDFAWANAYRQLGMSYYPKLVNAIPFTPVAGPRVLGADAAARESVARHLAGLSRCSRVSSLHSLFGDVPSTAAMQQAGALSRRGCQYRWHNRGYADFEDFLVHLSSKRRKEIRRERKRMRDAEVEVRVLAPSDISVALWRTLYAFYGRTYAMRGQAPYLTRRFFTELAERLPEQTLFFIAYHQDTPVGMAFMMQSADTLYGRHWGCETDYHSLHFETCYYAGIEYCIEHGLKCFDAGVQGEHKIRRGFEPVATWSTHLIDDDRLSAAVADFVAREGTMMADFQAEQRARCNFEADTAPAP